MTAAQWDDEARRLSRRGGFLGGALVGVMGLLPRFESTL
jgi:hypothetical protein